MQSITDAPDSLEEDQARRFRRYAFQMSVRTACFLGFVLIDHWTRWILALGAVLLPYVAVLLVNAGRDVTSRSVTPVDHARLGTAPEPPRASTGRTPRQEAMDDGTVEHETVEHRTVDHETVDHETVDHETVDHEHAQDATRPENPREETP
ncbi:hypothetical protein Slu03_26000 [Sediminihabitans luteus]|nr:hypothetical protein Slu03_26000 [Sediminihabitans luteus]